MTWHIRWHYHTRMSNEARCKTIRFHFAVLAGTAAEYKMPQALRFFKTGFEAFSQVDVHLAEPATLAHIEESLEDAYQFFTDVRQAYYLDPADGKAMADEVDRLVGGAQRHEVILPPAPEPIALGPSGHAEEMRELKDIFSKINGPGGSA